MSSKVLRDKIPKEAFIDEKPQVAHLCVFSTPVYIYIFDVKRTKLETSSFKGISKANRI